MESKDYYPVDLRIHKPKPSEQGIFGGPITIHSPTSIHPRTLMPGDTYNFTYSLIIKYAK